MLYSKTCVKRPLSKWPKMVLQTIYRNAGQKYCRMLQREHSAILSTCLKLPVVIKIFVVSIFVWPFYTGHLLGKGWPLGSYLWCLIVSLSLSHWYLGSGVVLDCIDSWSYFYCSSVIFIVIKSMKPMQNCQFPVVVHRYFYLRQDHLRADKSTKLRSYLPQSYPFLTFIWRPIQKHCWYVDKGVIISEGRQKHKAQKLSPSKLPFSYLHMVTYPEALLICRQRNYHI